MTLTVGHVVKGEAPGQVVMGDMLTIQAKLTLKHRGPPSSSSSSSPALPALPASACHAPHYPHAKAEGWVLVLTQRNAGRVLGVAAPPSWDKWTAASAGKDKGGGGGGGGGGITWTGELPMHVDTTGKMKVEVHAICSAYAGADVVTEVDVEVVARRTVRDDDDDDETDEDEEDGDEGDDVEFDDEVDDDGGQESD